MADKVAIWLSVPTRSDRHWVAVSTPREKKSLEYSTDTRLQGLSQRSRLRMWKDEHGGRNGFVLLLLFPAHLTHRPLQASVHVEAENTGRGREVRLRASCCWQLQGKRAFRILFPLLDPQAHFCGVKSHFPVLRRLHFPLLLFERPMKTNGENNWLNRKQWNLLSTKHWEKVQSKHLWPFLIILANTLTAKYFLW